jgi:hypothetical protein
VVSASRGRSACDGVTPERGLRGWGCVCDRGGGGYHGKALVKPPLVRAMSIHTGMMQPGVRSITATPARLAIAHYASAAGGAPPVHVKDPFP